MNERRRWAGEGASISAHKSRDKRIGRRRQGLNLRGKIPVDFKSTALTTRPRRLLLQNGPSRLYKLVHSVSFLFLAFPGKWFCLSSLCLCVCVCVCVCWGNAFSSPMLPLPHWSSSSPVLPRHHSAVVCPQVSLPWPVPSLFAACPPPPPPPLAPALLLLLLLLLPPPLHHLASSSSSSTARHTSPGRLGAPPVRLLRVVSQCATPPPPPVLRRRRFLKRGQGGEQQQAPTATPRDEAAVTVVTAVVVRLLWMCCGGAWASWSAAKVHLPFPSGYRRQRRR